MFCRYFACALLLSVVYPTLAQDLLPGWQNPPQSSKPRTWYHVMSGNMTAEGITQDFESMAEVGIGGLLLFNITQGIPNGDIAYDSPEHHALLTHAAREAERLDLSFGIHNCARWSSSGGPWVSPEQSMKMVVSSDVIVPGGKRTVFLPRPTMREGLYEDIAVFTYPTLPGELADRDNYPRISSSDGNLDLTIIADGRAEERTKIHGEGSYIEYAFVKPTTVHSAQIIMNGRHSTVDLQASDDGQTWREIGTLNKVRTGKNEWGIDDAFPEGVRGQYFRLVFNRNTELKQVELRQRAAPRNLLSRIGIARTTPHQLGGIGVPADTRDVIDPAALRNVTNALSADGALSVDLPAGAWTILRIGYTSTGAFNHPAGESGRGLEVDKLDGAAVAQHYDAFVGEVVDNVRAADAARLDYVEIDSYEMGGQNWTPGFGESFQAAHGYDLTAYLPLMAGRLVGSAEESERVMEDLRQHVDERFVDGYFRKFTELAHADGMLTYVEPYGLGPFSYLDAGGTCDIPMGEFWMQRDKMVVTEAVSAAHVYNKPVVSAESFTSQPQINWGGHPAMAKHDGDRAWSRGVNEFMFHRFTHQANTHVTPGMTMNRWGFHFDRTQTWWRGAGKAWFEYLARGSHFLRQGQPVADALVFVGDGASTGVFEREDFTPALPGWLNFDNDRGSFGRAHADAYDAEAISALITTTNQLLAEVD